MENKKLNQDITLTIQSGGIVEFEKTGVIPRYLVFYSRNLRRTWRFKQLNDTQNGVLKVNVKIAFQYFLDELGCKMQSVSNGFIGAEWEIEEIIMELRD